MHVFYKETFLSNESPRRLLVGVFLGGSWEPFSVGLFFVGASSSLFFENCCGVVFALLPPLYLEQNDMFSHVFIFI